MGRVRSAIGLLLAVVVGLPALAGPAAARTAADTGPAPLPFAAAVAPDSPRLLVRFAPGATAADRAAAVGAVGGVADQWLPAVGATRVALPVRTDPSGDAAGFAALRLARDPAVAAVQLDAKARADLTPNDTLYANDPIFGLGQWGLRAAQVDKAWDVTRGAPSVIVAVIDTGIDANHPDLTGVALPGATFVSGPDPICVPGTQIDDNGHGTHVAGVIAANANNGQGIAGIAFGVKILPVKALDCTGAGLLSDIAQAILWATDHGARIINISLGADTEAFPLHDAIRYAAAHNVLVVAAAGNCGLRSTLCATLNDVSYPAAYPEVLAVGATDTTDQHATFSTSASYVGIAAPGDRIWSTTPTYPTVLSVSLSGGQGAQTYGWLRGTSQSAPFVSGVAALIASHEPALTAQQITDRMKATADTKCGPGPDAGLGAGRVNAYRAVSQIVSARYAAAYDTSAVPVKANVTQPLQAAVRVMNTSGTTWGVTTACTSPVRLGYHWLDANGVPVVWEGARTAIATDLVGGSSTVVTAQIVTPKVAGTYTLAFDLVQDGIAWFSSKGVPTGNVTVRVTSGLDATYAPTAGAASTFGLGVNTFGVSVANTGLVPWPAGGANPVHLSYHWLKPDGSVVVWEGARASLPADVAPGQAAVVPLAVSAPATPGQYVLRLDLVQEGIAWFSGQGVVPRDLQINVTSGLAATYTLGAAVPALLPGGRITVPLSVRNDGLVAWAAGGPNPVHAAVHVYDAEGALVSWDGERAAFAADVAPGQTGTTALAINAPAQPGTYTLRIDLVREGVAWFSSSGVPTANVTLSDAADYRASFALPTPLSISRSAPTVTVTLTNTSLATWTPTGLVPVDVGSHWLAADGTPLAWDGPRAVLPQAVAPGGSVTVTLPLAPPPPGAAALVVDLVAEGLRWFGVGSPRPATLVP